MNSPTESWLGAGADRSSLFQAQRDKAGPHGQGDPGVLDRARSKKPIALPGGNSAANSWICAANEPGRNDQSRPQSGEPTPPVCLSVAYDMCALTFDMSGDRKQTQPVEDVRSIEALGLTIAAIETFRPGMRAGSLAPWRADGLEGNHLSHSYSCRRIVFVR